MNAQTGRDRIPVSIQRRREPVLSLSIISLQRPRRENFFFLMNTDDYAIKSANPLQIFKRENSQHARHKYDRTRSPPHLCPLREANSPLAPRSLLGPLRHGDFFAPPRISSNSPYLTLLISIRNDPKKQKGKNMESFEGVSRGG